MAPDDLRPLASAAELAAWRQGRPILVLETVDSTNLEARRLAEQGAAEGTVVIADAQTGGRGRMGRSWVSPAGVNLYLSLVLRPKLTPRHAPQLTLLASLAVAEALESCFGLAAAVKWPNDVLLGGKKVAGLLGEIAATMAGIEYIVMGIGLNLNMSAAQFPERPLYAATSVAIEKGEPVPRLPVAIRLLELLDDYYRLFLKEGFAPIRSRWERRCPMRGKRLAIDTGNGVVSGEALGLDADGALLLRLGDGGVERVLSGDVLAFHGP